MNNNESDAIKAEIRRLFDSIKTTPYPQSCHAAKYRDLHLVMLDSTLAGCVSSLVSDFDPLRRPDCIDVVRRSKDTLEQITLQLDDECNVQFKTWLSIVTLMTELFEEV